MAFRDVLQGMSIYIDDEELVVGNQASSHRAAPVFPEYAIKWISEELDTISKRDLDPFDVSEEDKEILRGVIPYWQGNTLEERIMATVPGEVRKALESRAIMGEHLLTCGDGHLTVDFQKVLRDGLRGSIAEIEDHLKRLNVNEPDALGKRTFLQAAKITCEAAIAFAHRYADLAARMASEEQNPVRKAELLKIAETCSHVPENPPRNFMEAVQSVYFVQLLLQIESNGHSVSLGRFDKYVYPYYHADRVNGRANRQEALDLVSCLFIKMFSMMKTRPWIHVQFAAGYITYQNVTIGGHTLSGGDSTNDVTYLCLDASSSLKLPAPSLAARFHNGSPQVYLQRCAEVIAEGFGMPAMENDEVIIPALLLRGVTPEDAYDYAMVGCVEVSVPGKWGYRCNGMTFLNMAKVLEIALNNGVEPRTGHAFPGASAGLVNADTFDQLMASYRSQIAYFTKMQVAFDGVVDSAMEDLCPDAFCSALVQDCIGRGKNLKEGGAVYDMTSGVQVGLANVANSLAAIKNLVFDTGSIDAGALKRALDSNFQDEEDQQIRQMLINRAPKYGNDDDDVDLLAKEAYGYYIDEISKHRNARYGRGPLGCSFFGSTSTVSSNVPSGKAVGASADGRMSGTPLAEGSSPAPGTDSKGPTAVIKSITKLPTVLVTGGQLLNLKFSPVLFENSSGIQNLIHLLRTFSFLRGWHIQFNVISAETLRLAQQNPQEYSTLTVRVAGYCAFFTQLKAETQEDIIRRTEHVMS